MSPAAAVFDVDGAPDGKLVKLLQMPDSLEVSVG